MTDTQTNLQAPAGITTEPGEDQDELDRVPIRDNGEPLVNFLHLTPRLVFTPKHPFLDFPRLPMVREAVAAMLVQAAEALPQGLKLRVVEGYRPLGVQRVMFQFATDHVRKLHPEWDEARILLHAGRFSAPPDAITPPPHITGGAVDLEIVDDEDQLLDFISPYEFMDIRQADPFAPLLTDTARANRALLRSVLEPTGLTNYVDEWWHWSYGDNGWALRTGAPNAIYDRAELPPHAEWIGDLSKLPKD